MVTKGEPDEARSEVGNVVEGRKIHIGRRGNSRSTVIDERSLNMCYHAFLHQLPASARRHSAGPKRDHDFAFLYLFSLGIQLKFLNSGNVFGHPQGISSSTSKYLRSTQLSDLGARARAARIQRGLVYSVAQDSYALTAQACLL